MDYFSYNAPAAVGGVCAYQRGKLETRGNQRELEGTRGRVFLGVGGDRGSVGLWLSKAAHSHPNSDGGLTQSSTFP